MKNIYNEKYLRELGLNNRQLDVLLHFKYNKEIKSSEYMRRYKITDRTARYDLSELVEKNLLLKQGNRKSSKYIYPINFR